MSRSIAPVASGLRDMHSAGPAPVANGTNAWSRTALRIVHGAMHEHHGRGEDREVADRLAPRAPHREARDEERDDQQADRSGARARRRRSAAPLTTSRTSPGSSASSRWEGARAWSPSSSVMKTVSNWSVAVVAIEVGVHGDDRGAIRARRARRTRGDASRNTNRIVSVPSSGLHVFDRAHEIAVGDRRVPDRPTRRRRRTWGSRADRTTPAAGASARLVVLAARHVRDVDERVRVALAARDRLALEEVRLGVAREPRVHARVRDPRDPGAAARPAMIRSAARTRATEAADHAWRAQRVSAMHGRGHEDRRSRSPPAPQRRATRIPSAVERVVHERGQIGELRVVAGDRRDRACAVGVACAPCRAAPSRERGSSSRAR